VGVWQGVGGEAIVYDGCHVSFIEDLSNEPPILAGLRNIARAGVVDVRDYGDPAPYYRTAMVWRGARLHSRSILVEYRWIARWDGASMRLPAARLVRVRELEALSTSARMLLCARRVVPTEAQIAAEWGVPLRRRPPGPPNAVRDIFCPTDDCE
jgi:hypothetical protein